MSSLRNLFSNAIPILKALPTSSQITRFTPYMLTSSLHAQRKFPGLENIIIPTASMKDFARDNQLVMTWFHQRQQRFYQWRRPQSLNTNILEATGSRSFGASYTESDLECAIVTEKFEDFLELCRFLNTHYQKDHQFIALKTSAGLPLLIIKGKQGFVCPELSKLYPEKILPRLEVTFRYPNVHQLIQEAGKNFFARLSMEELESYVVNKRYIELMSRNLPKDATFEGKPLKTILEEFKSALASELQCLPAGKLQDMPAFNQEVFEAAVKSQTVLSSMIYSGNTAFFQPGDNKNEIKPLNHSVAPWLELISKETAEHCAYLASIGLGERATYFKVKEFIYQDSLPYTDISRFQTMDLPETFHTFDTQEKNTLFTHPDSTQEQEIQRVLDIRLYPSMRRMIEKHGTTLFPGSKIELQAYTASCKEKLIIEVEIPSSVKFYLALTQAGDTKVYMSSMVSHENVLQQLLTLKLAGIDAHKITLLGNPQHYQAICKADLATFEKNASTYLTRRNVLIVAGCGLENTVCTTLEQMFSGKITLQKFSGQIVSLTYALSPQVPHLGFIVLNLNYGEICEEQVAFILEKFNCIGIFSGSASGYIPKAAEEKLPNIGDRIPVHAAKHHSGEMVLLDKQAKNLHLHVPTIFVETFKWLEQAKALGATTVDVETFYLLRAIQRFQKTHPESTLHTDIGVFISDYVGIKPLRAYKNVFAHYPLLLQNFVTQVLVENITSSYNNNRITLPTFAPHYIGLDPDIIAIHPELKKEAVVDSIGRCWDKSEFAKRVHTPVSIGVVKNQERFTSQNVPRCLHLPIKLPGSDIRIPAEYQVFMDELQQIFNFETSVNPGWNNLYAYLTVDQGFVARANSQRVPGPHVDGIPRDRENPGAQVIDHAYLVTNAVPTMFYTQQFDMSAYDPRIHHFFAILRALSDESRTIMAKQFDILLMNAYSVHTPTQTLEDVNRTFIRLEFSTLKFDRAGNSINPHFASDDKFSDYPFNYVPRPIPNNLFVPPSVYVKKPITHEDYSHEDIDHFGRINLQAFYTQNSKYTLKYNAYKDLDIIAKDMMNAETNGIIACHQGIPHAFGLYKIENKTVKLQTLFILENGKGQEMMIYLLKNLQKIADKLANREGLDNGAIPITIVEDENNTKMLFYFLRAARLAKIDVNIERVENKLNSTFSLSS